MNETTSQIEICPKTHVPEGEVICVEHNDLELAVYNVEGEFFVTDNMCTHGPGELSEGYLEGDFLLNEFVDRYGPRLAHLNGVLQVLSQLSNTPAATNTSNPPS